MYSINAILVIAFAASTAQSFRHFTSQVQSFSADYPSNWNIVGSESDLGSAKDRLDIISFPDGERTTAVVIKRGGAEIILRRQKGTGEVPIDDKLLERRTIMLSSRSFCSSASAIRVLDPIVIAADIPSGVAIHQDVTNYNCTNGETSFTLTLRHFKDDAKHDYYVKVAQAILESVRSTK